MKKKSFIISFFFLLSLNIYSQENINNLKFDMNIWNKGEVFQLQPVQDVIILSTDLALNTTWLLCDKILDVNKKNYNGTQYYKENVNSFDRLFMNPYSKGLDITADITVGLSVCAPLFLLYTDSNEWITIGTMYAETLLLTNGIKEIGKIAASRVRPYMYYDNYPQKAIENGDWCKSWPSGHTAFSFASATFFSYVFTKYFPDSNWKYAVYATSYSLALTTGILRIKSGNHFCTDVISGAAIGTLCGFLVPWLHSINLKTNNTVSVTPTSINFTFKF